MKKIKNIFNKLHDKHILPHHCNHKVKHTLDTTVAAIGLMASLMAVPQVVKVYTTHNITSLSLVTWVTAFIASLAWFVYGVFYKSKPLVISSSLNAAVNFMMVASFVIY